MYAYHVYIKATLFNKTYNYNHGPLHGRWKLQPYFIVE